MPDNHPCDLVSQCFLLTVPFRGMLLTPRGGPRCFAPTAHQIPVYLMVFSTFLCRAYTAHRRAQVHDPEMPFSKNPRKINRILVFCGRNFRLDRPLPEGSDGRAHV